MSDDLESAPKKPRKPRRNTRPSALLKAMAKAHEQREGGEPGDADLSAMDTEALANGYDLHEDPVTKFDRIGRAQSQRFGFTYDENDPHPLSHDGTHAWKQRQLKRHNEAVAASWGEPDDTWPSERLMTWGAINGVVLPSPADVGAGKSTAAGEALLRMMLAATAREKAGGAGAGASAARVPNRIDAASAPLPKLGVGEVGVGYDLVRTVSAFYDANPSATGLDAAAACRCSAPTIYAVKRKVREQYRAEGKEPPQWTFVGKAGRPRKYK